MFAGARITFLRPLTIGSPARRVGTVTEITAKTGRTGPLTFVQVRQEIAGPDGPALVEEQDIVYRTHPAPGAAGGQAGGPRLDDAAWTEVYLPDATALLRYSALLFNAHRIHYDYRYVTGIEHYPDLVVHGQLVATLLADLAERKTGPLASFAFRSHAAFFVDRPITLMGRADGDEIRLAAIDDNGLVAMTAEARSRPRA
jgi:3-methylfumaryl-CoA hydratase